MPRQSASARSRIALAAAFLVLAPVWSAPLATPAHAQAASVVENVRVTFGNFTVVIPRIEAQNSSLAPDAIRALFDPKAAEPLSARLARFGASAVTIPQLTVEQAAGKERVTTVYRDIRMENLRDGKAENVRIGGATFANDATGKERVEGTLGASTIAGMDFAQIARFYADSTANPGPRLPIYASSVTEGLTMRLPEGGQVRVGRITAKDARARAGQGSLIAEIDALMAGQTGRKPTDAERLKNLQVSLKMFDRLSLAESEIRDIRLDGVTTPEGPVEGGIARIAFRMPEAGENAFEMEGLAFAAGGGTFNLERLASSGFSLAGLRETLARETAKPDFDPKKLNAWGLIPTFGTFRMEGLSGDLPATEGGRPTGERLRMRLQSAEIAATQPRNGIPTRIRYAVDGFSAPLPPDTKNEGLRTLRDLGLTSLDVSMGFEIEWAENAREIAIRNLRLNGVDLGAFTASATLANAGPELFATDTTVQQVAAIGVTARALELRYRDSGLVRILIEQQAKRTGRTAEAVRREYATTAALVGPVMLGPSQAARDIASAVGQFLAKPGMLTITARTKEPGGLGFMDVMMLGQPAAILDQLEVKAVAE